MGSPAAGQQLLPLLLVLLGALLRAERPPRAAAQSGATRQGGREARVDAAALRR